MVNVQIVEDIDDVRLSLQDYFNTIADFSCTHNYANAEDAFSGFLLNKPDVVIMDIGLPGVSGIECLMRLKQMHADVKVLMFTIFEDDDHVFEALKAGADGYILKKEPVEKIYKAIREVLQQGAPMSGSIALKVIQSFKVERPKPKAHLSPRQSEVLQQLAKGLPYKLIADHLGVSIGTIKQHIHQIYKKLQVNNKVEAINKYLYQ